MATAVLDAASFQALFPEFAYVNGDVLKEWYSLAGVLYLRNDGTGPVRTDAAQGSLMNLLTAHLLKLFYPAPCSGGSVAPVGRIATATEGSITVNLEYAGDIPESAAFYLQTQYGAAYWNATSIYRRFRYVPGPQRYFGGGFGRGSAIY